MMETQILGLGGQSVRLAGAFLQLSLKANGQTNNSLFALARRDLVALKSTPILAFAVHSPKITKWLCCLQNSSQVPTEVAMP